MTIFPLFNKISDILFDDGSGEAYRRLMQAMTDILQQHPVLQREAYCAALDYAAGYWQEGSGSADDLQKHHETVRAAMLRYSVQRANPAQQREITVARLHCTVLRPFHPQEVDAHCDALYWFVECTAEFVVRPHQSAAVFEQWFADWI